VHLNYNHSAILFGNTNSTLGSVLGFDYDIKTTDVVFDALTSTSVNLDILYRESESDEGGGEDEWGQVSITIPTIATPTTALLISTINTLVADELAEEGSQYDGVSPYNAMIHSINVKPVNGNISVKLTYTNGNLVRIKGHTTLDDTGADVSALDPGQLRSGLPTDSFIGGGFGVGQGGGPWAHFGNPYKYEYGYLHALAYPIASSMAGAGEHAPSTAEKRTHDFIVALGADQLNNVGDTGQGYRSMISVVTPNANMSTWLLAQDVHEATMPATHAANIGKVTEVGLAVEPLVAGARDTGGKSCGTLARFVIPKGSDPGDILGLETVNPTRVDIQRFVDQEISDLTFRLVDQHNDSITDLAGEDFSAVVVISHD